MQLLGCWKKDTFQKKNKMKKIITILVVIAVIAGIVLTCCNAKHVQEERKRETDSSMFVIIEETDFWQIVYNKETKVMYAVSVGAYNRGTFTMLCDKDGKPQLWGGNNNE